MQAQSGLYPGLIPKRASRMVHWNSAHILHLSRVESLALGATRIMSAICSMELTNLSQHVPFFTQPHELRNDL
jgi:hypothetical protein